LLERDKPGADKSLWSKYRRELIAANRIACNERIAWTI